MAAAATTAGTLRWWTLGRGISDLLLTAVLVASVPLAAVISVIAGGSWPPRAAAILANFIALSLLTTGLSLLGAGATSQRSREESTGADA